MAGGMDRGQGRARGLAAALALTLVAAGAPPGGAAEPQPLVVRYEAYAAGFPVVGMEFRLDENGAAYAVGGRIRTLGLLRLFYGLVLLADSQGTIGAVDIHPHSHEHALRSRGRDRQARLDFAEDGTVVAALVPPEESGRPRPTAAQILRAVDPLTAILAIGHAVARSGRCGGSFAVFDGRRRYDVVVTDDGDERLEPSAAYAYAGDMRRCLVGVVKIAGFSFDQDYAPHTSNGRVWLASPRAGAPALPVRIDFDSSWGSIEVRMTEIERPK